MTSAHVENLEFDTSQRDGSVNVAATTPIERPKMAANTPREWPKGRSRGGKLLVRRMADVRICNIADGGRRQMFNWSPTGKSRINSLHAEIACNAFPNDGRARELFDAGTRELLRARLIRTDWPTRPVNEQEFFGMHATDLGWAVIGDKWTELKKPSALTT